MMNHRLSSFVRTYWPAMLCVVLVHGGAQGDSPNQPFAAAFESMEPGQRYQLVRRLTERLDSHEVLDVLRRSGLPLTGDSHLLVHEVGYAAYRRYRNEALTRCTSDFLYACYHGVVIQAIAEQGPSGVARLLDRCRVAGVEAGHQCAHAVGHGLLAWTAYQLRPALEFCDTIMPDDSASRLHCHVGGFMENIYGVHGRPAFNGQEWHGGDLKLADPHYPCNAVREHHRSGCYLNQASQMYRAFNGDLRKVAASCARTEEGKHRSECFDGFARLVLSMANGDAKSVVALCGNAGSVRDVECIGTIAAAASSLGDRRLVAALCGASKGGEPCAPSGSVYEGDEAIVRPATHQGTEPAYELPYATPQPSYLQPYFSPYLNPYMSPYHVPYLRPYSVPPHR